MGWKAAQKLIHHWKILRGDNVMIIRGKDKGETGIIQAKYGFHSPEVLYIQSNMFWLTTFPVQLIRSNESTRTGPQSGSPAFPVKKHIKQGQGHEGGIFSVEAPLHVSNVQVLDPVTGKPSKVGYRYLEDGTKVRVSRGIGASGSIVPRPDILKIRTTPRPTVVGPKDTPLDLVSEKTYDAKTGMGMPDL
ncbi:KOW domain-containing protein [Abeliophyllum distichum]|uniref:KOW domain-containing protein n=1 Tax=Abeliophyllum distichum TaxID=126358 RepID=A0ABD1TXZ1_9LAMI